VYYFHIFQRKTMSPLPLALTVLALAVPRRTQIALDECSDQDGFVLCAERAMCMRPWEHACAPIPPDCVQWFNGCTDCPVKGETPRCGAQCLMLEGSSKPRCLQYKVSQNGSVDSRVHITVDATVVGDTVVYDIGLRLSPCVFLLALFGDEPSPLTLPATPWASDSYIRPGGASSDKFSAVGIGDTFSTWDASTGVRITNGAWFTVPSSHGRDNPGAMTTDTVIGRVVLPNDSSRATITLNVQLYNCAADSRPWIVRGLQAELYLPSGH
jgi:hypothetical protein